MRTLRRGSGTLLAVVSLAMCVTSLRGRAEEPSVPEVKSAASGFVGDGDDHIPDLPSGKLALPSAKPTTSQPAASPHVLFDAGSAHAAGGSFAASPIPASTPAASQQMPLSAGKSQLNQPSFATRDPMVQPASYTAGAPMPYAGAAPYGAYGPMPVHPASYPTQPPMPPTYPTSVMGGGMGPMMGPMGGEMMSADGSPIDEYSAMGGYPEGYPGDGYSMDGYGGSPFCPLCGGQGCDNCAGIGDGVLGNFLQRLLPYSEGGRCAPRWYDIALDGMYIRRENVGADVAFATFTAGGDAALSSTDLNYDEQLGMRFNAAIQMLPGYNLEFSYFGLFNWSSVATVSDPTNNLFSIYSNYGLNPPNGFDETDQSSFQSLRSSSTLDSLELSIRKRWTGPNCRLQGSWLSGVRYVYLVDDLEYFTIGRAGQSDTDLRTRNSLTGYQVGGDIWANIVPGISIGADLKGGVYGNYAKANTTAVTTNGGIPTLYEAARTTDIAFVGEANIQFIYKVSPNWTVRAGYSFVYLEGVALAPDNFNPTNPFGIGRTVQNVDDDADVFYHGGFGGFEWMW